MSASTDHLEWPSGFATPEHEYDNGALNTLTACSWAVLIPMAHYYCFSNVIYIRRTPSVWLKLLLTIVLFSFDMIGVVIRYFFSQYRHGIATDATVFDIASPSCILIAVYLEHRRGIRASAFLSLYITIGLLRDVNKTEAYFSRDQTFLCQLTATSTVLRFVLFCFQELVKPELAADLVTQQHGQTRLNGYWVGTALSPLSQTLQARFWNLLSVDRSGRLGIELSSASLFFALSQRRRNGARTGGTALLMTCLATWRSSLVAIALPRLCATAFLFTQPYLIRRLVFSQRQEIIETDKQNLVAAVFIVFNGAAICKAAATYMKYRLLAKIRGGLIAEVFAKTQRLRLSEAKKYAAITLINSDIDGICSGFPTFVDFPFSIVDTCLGMYLLEDIVKQASFIIFLPLILAIILGYVFGNYLTPAIRTWNQNVESRVLKTTNVLAQLPTIKMLGLSPKIAEFLHHLRVSEIKSSWKFRYIQSGLISTTGFLDMITPVLVVAGVLFWQIFPRLSTELIFPALALIALVQEPIMNILRSGTSTVAFIGSFWRVQEYLFLDEADDPRVLLTQEPRDVTRNWPTNSGSQAMLTKSVRKIPTCVIYFENVSISPLGMGEPLLRNLNILIAPGSVTTLFGHTGSGKTTFVNGILGEGLVYDGVLYVDDMPIAVCGQKVWLPDETIRRCIIGALEYDAAWFRTVITVCRLVDDINQLEAGEFYVVGSDGIKLSGGQRQRLSVARAVYAKASTILLDDAFSAVDRPTAAAIIADLCNKTNGLLRRLNCTVLMTSYMQECLDVSDKVLLIETDGTITEKTSTALGDGVLAAVLRLLYGGESTGAGADDSSASESESETRLHRSPPPQPPAPIHDQSRVMVRRTTPRQQQKSNLYRAWVDAIGRFSLLKWLLLVLIMCAAEGSPKIYMRWWIGTFPAEKMLIIGYAMLSATAGLLGGPCVFINTVKLSPYASISLHDTLTDVVLRSTLGFLSANIYGSILTRYSVDMDLIARHVAAGVYNNLYMGITTLFQAGIVFSGAQYMLVLLPLLCAILFAIQRNYAHALRKLRDLEKTSQEQLVKFLREISDGLLHIRGFHWQDFALHRTFDLLDQSQKPFYLLLCTQQLLALSLDLIAFNMAGTLSALALYIPGCATDASLGLSLLITIIFGRALNRALTTWTGLETTLGSLESMSDFLENTPVETVDNKTPLPENWPAYGRVQMTNVSAGYLCDQGDEETAAIIQNITLTVEPGQKVGITGRTGGGKSSLLMSLLGLLEYEGTIAIDGVDIRNAPLDQLRSRIITIPQNSIQLEGTIRDNLLPFEKTWAEGPQPPETTEAEKRRRDYILRETLDDLRLWALLEDKRGLQTLIGDAGFSEGEVQLLSIARAVVHRRLYGGNLVLVDEAGEGVDAWRDQMVREMLRDYFEGCTVLVVAHHSESIADSNVSFKMVQGRMQSYKHWF